MYGDISVSVQKINVALLTDRKTTKLKLLCWLFVVHFLVRGRLPVGWLKALARGGGVEGK